MTSESTVADITEDTIVHLEGMTGTVRAFVAGGWLEPREGEDGKVTYLTKGPYAHPPEVVPPDSPKYPHVDPYSLRGLQMRGYRVMAGKTREEDRVEIGGGFFRISAARENGLI